jgi:hypothetical protein
VPVVTTLPVIWVTSFLPLQGDKEIAIIKLKVAIILNHPRGWDGKPKGLYETAGSPNYQ